MKLYQEVKARIQGFKFRKDEKGLTLLEIMIVIALIATLMGIIVSNLNTQQDNAKDDQTRIQFGNISTGLQQYRLRHNRYPTTTQGLEALIKNPGISGWRGPYIEASKLKDAFGNDIDYELNGTNYKLTSPGRDGQLGTKYDIIYPEASEETSAEAGEE